jgi:hypothetical protein
MIKVENKLNFEFITFIIPRSSLPEALYVLTRSARSRSSVSVRRMPTRKPRVGAVRVELLVADGRAVEARVAVGQLERDAQRDGVADEVAAADAYVRQDDADAVQCSRRASAPARARARRSPRRRAARRRPAGSPCIEARAAGRRLTRAGGSQSCAGAPASDAFQALPLVPRFYFSGTTTSNSFVSPAASVTRGAAGARLFNSAFGRAAEASGGIATTR